MKVGLAATFWVIVGSLAHPQSPDFERWAEKSGKLLSLQFDEKLSKEMKFATLIYIYTWDEVRPVLLRLYPDQEENIEGYEQVYLTLQTISPSQTNMQIIIENMVDRFTSEHYVDVSGKIDPQKEGTSKSIEPVEDSKITYAIEFVDWSEWLEMEIEPETQTRFSDLEIIAHCLWEMTFVGYNREEIREQFEEIKQAKIDFEFQDLIDVDELFGEDW